MKDLGRIIREMAKHKLEVILGACPVRQKLCLLKGKEAVVKEVDKLRESRIVRPVRYPKWLTNVVMIRKTDARWHMCVDFTNLKAACLKDCYSLPSVDHVDKSSCVMLLSFMDTQAGYNQIHKAKEDKEKMVFIIDE